MVYIPPIINRAQAEQQTLTRKQEKARNDAKKKEFKKSQAKKETKTTRKKAIADAADKRKKQIEKSGSWGQFYLNMRTFLTKDNPSQLFGIEGDALNKATKTFKTYQNFIKRKRAITYDRQTGKVALDFKVGVKLLKKEAKEIAENSTNKENAKRDSGAEHVLNYLETAEWVETFLTEYESVIVAGFCAFPGFLHVEQSGFKSTNFIETKTTNVFGEKNIFGGQKKRTKLKFKKKSIASLINYGLNEANQALAGIMIDSIKYDPKGDLMAKVALIIMGWWAFRQLNRDDTPIFATPPALRTPGDRTIMGFCIFPGVFIPTPLLPAGTVDQWLLSFIVNANLHLLTVIGTTITFHKTSLTGVPIPAMVTPWFGYITKPFAVPVINPFSKPLKEMLQNPKELLAEVKENIIEFAAEEAIAETVTTLKEKGVGGTIDAAGQAITAGAKATTQVVTNTINRVGG
jgi:hypothetical protein